MARRLLSSSMATAALCVSVAAFGQTTGQNPTQSTGQAESQTMTQPHQPGDRSATKSQVTLVGCVQRESDYRKAHSEGRGGALGMGTGVDNEFVLTEASPASRASQMSSTSSSPGATSAAGTATTTSEPSSAATPPTTATEPTTSATPPSSTGTSGTTSATTTAGTSDTGSSYGPSAKGNAYSLTGDREKELDKYVGQRVEIVGTLENSGKASMPGNASTPTGGSTTGTAGTSTTTGTTSSTSSTSIGSTTSSGTYGSTTGSAATSGFGDLPRVNITSFRPAGGSCSPQ
jgi:hypothetical protein